jgi:membrane-bound metal-dependent hydrolase YbcI (DUF457 family)
MWPIGHASVAYLLYTALSRQRFDTGPTAIAAVLVGFGGIFPDLGDKTRSWAAGILPTGRSLSHSLLVIVPMVVAVYLAARWYTDPEYGVAFGVGAFSHPLVDAFPALWDSGASWEFLLWPIVPVTPYDEAPTLLGLLQSSLSDPYFVVEFLLLALAVAVWRVDGYPGLSVLPGVDVGDQPT